MLFNTVLLALAAATYGQITSYDDNSKTNIVTHFSTSFVNTIATVVTTVTASVTITLTPSTSTSLVTPSPTTVVSTVNVGKTVVENVTVGGAGGTITVPNHGNPTITGPAITTTRPGTKTVYITLSGLNTVTHTVTSGYTTVRNCLPTTTIITTVTTPVPTATSPAGEVVTFHRQNCASVVCSAGSTTVTVNGTPKACTLIYYREQLISTTCMVDYCCRGGDDSDGAPTIRPTTCAASGLSCPAGSVMLSTANGASVPCLHSYQKNQLVASTCDQSVCCSAGSGSGGSGGQVTVTVTAGQSDTGSNGGATTVTVRPTSTSSGKSVSCKTAVKCRVYAKDRKTNYIKKCRVNDSDDDRVCDTENCCESKLK